MASAMEKRLATLEVEAGITAPDRIHVVLTAYGINAAVGPEIPPRRVARPGRPDLLILCERRVYDDSSTTLGALRSPHDAP